LPERKDGVRHTIDYIAYSHPSNGAIADKDNLNPSQGPSIPTGALEQASKLLSSIPKNRTAEDYLSQIAPQLLHLLDGAEGPELSRASAFVIGDGILSKRALGAPDCIGWKLFVEPQFKTFRPVCVGPIPDRTTKSNNSLISKELVSHEELRIAVNRLAALVDSHPSPSLTGRLLRPIIVPLWGLANYTNAVISKSDLSQSASSLLDTFFRLSSNPSHLHILSENLLWDGTADWEYGPSGDGRVTIRERDGGKSINAFDVITAIPNIEHRVSTFLHILSLVEPSTIGAVFLDLSKKWLLPQSKQSSDALSVESDPIKPFAQAKLVQAVLEKFQDTISKQPEQVLGLIEQILSQLDKDQAAKLRAKRTQTLETPTFNTLSSLRIIHKEDNAEVTQSGVENDSEEMLTVAISLLNAMLSSPEFKHENDTALVTHRIQDLLLKLSTGSQALSTPLKLSIQTALSLIQSANQKPNQQSTGTKETSQSTEQAVHQTLSEIANDLSSDLPPLRSSALHALQALIKTADLPVDAPTITLLLLHTLRTDPEEFVYLAAVRTLVELAMRRELSFTVKLTAEAFNDVKEESGVDGRLRVGEALNTVVEALSEPANRVSGAEKHQVIEEIMAVVIPVAGRRGNRKREMHENQQKERLEKRRRREAERAWGGEVPDLPDEDVDIDPVTRERNRLELEAIDKIVKGWEQTGFEDDVRVRTSALSILGQVLERCMDDCSPSNVESAVELALSILTMELGPEKAILRRAAALSLLSILKAANEISEARKGSVGLDAEKWNNIEKVLDWVVKNDDDELVVGHATAAAEGLEAWRMGQIFRARDQIIDGSGSLNLDGRLKGLDVNPEPTSTQAGGFKRIEELD
jgi:hypothetical protein